MIMWNYLWAICADVLKNSGINLTYKITASQLYMEWKYEVCQQNLLRHIIYDVSPRDELHESSVYGSQWIYHIVSDTIKV